MLVFDNKPVIFIWIQKTGGTWVSEVLPKIGITWRNIGRHHMSIKEARVNYQNHFAFTIIRNPLTWYQSYWAMKTFRAESDGYWDHTGLGPLNKCGHDNFNVFMSRVLSKHPGYLTSLFDQAIDKRVYIMKKENLVNSFISLLEYLKIKFERSVILDYPFAHRGSSLPEYRERVLYTVENAERLLETESEIFIRYAYDSNFDGVIL